MPDLPKFEDWTAPWTEDEFDAERAKKFVYDLKVDVQSLSKEKKALTADNRSLKSEVEAFETKDDTELQKAQREIEKLKAEKDKPTEGETRAEILYDIALEKGLNKSQLKRLSGSTREELEADADEFLESIGGAKNKADEDDAKDKGGNANELSNRQPKKLKNNFVAGEDQESQLSVDQILDRALAAKPF